ncbi:MAG: lipase [Candidatus Thiodiazotropha sp. (ex Monitilora ramsayi)]|nr:lipase [Candidatus Thiodiazotropha sp. (ex Monitilora ramsayi)]
MKRLKYLFTTLLLLLPTLTPADQGEGDCAILLHGMGRTSMSMGAIEDALIAQGYTVWNEGYPSLTQSLEEFATPMMESAITYCRDNQAPSIHFVTHSLGGIIVRYYLQNHQIDNLGRIVMLAPPNKGSEVADGMKDGFFYQTIMGPNAQVLGTDENSLPNRLKPIDGEIGIIAGEADGEPWFLPEIPGADDGKVAVERTKLPEMKDFLRVKSGHTFIMRDDEVIRQILHFLQNGFFDKKRELSE